MTAEEFAAATVGTTEQRDIQVRQVSNGFVLVVNRRFVDDGTATVRFGLSSEGVASNTTDAIGAVTNFLTNGEF